MKPRFFSGFLEKKIFFCILKGEMHKIHIFFPEKNIIKKMYVPTLRTVTQNTRIFLFGLAVIFYSFFLLSTDIFYIYHRFGSTIRVSDNLDPDQDRHPKLVGIELTSPTLLQFLPCKRR